ncbi:hypothetical protein Q9233_015454 [Columba guinea]|nr:hypothetical protein Q9233_015454 [Columba guinea]
MPLDYRACRERQKSRKMEIVSRILQEKASIHKQKKSQSRTKAIKSARKLEDPGVWRRRAWRYIEQTCSHPAGATPQKSWRSPSACSSAGERSPSVEEVSKTPCDVLWERGEDEKEKDRTLAEPEFPGLWSQEHDLRKISKEETDLKKLSTRTEKKEIFHKQIVSGHEYKERTFYSKPSCIHFKDFDVGQIYKKKIVLINASYSVNSCRLVGISEWLKDFISICFDPPGKVCAGMSCEVLVTFKPMLALDKELIDFGNHVVGETISRTITLTNSGALGTRFRVQPSAGDSSTGRATAKSSPETLRPCGAVCLGLQLSYYPYIKSTVQTKNLWNNMV